MADVRPFRALRPRPDLAARVIAPPYDVLNDEEVRALAADPLHFVHVTRSECDLPAGADAHSDLAYRKARENLDRLVAQGTLLEDEHDGYAFYGQQMGEHRQVALLGVASVAEYDDGRIRKHEHTRPDKEDDRTHHMEVLDAQVGLVFLAHRADATLAALSAEATSGEPLWQVTTEDGVIHTFWQAPDHLTEPLRQALAGLPALYVADGHHRSAAASRVHARRGDALSAHFLVGLFPDDQLQILPYNRVIHDLHGLGSDELRAALAVDWTLTDDPTPPAQRGDVSMFLNGRWSTLRVRPERLAGRSPTERLDVSLLQDLVLGPLLGIADPRRSERITFVGGIRGRTSLEQQATARGGVAFQLYPTGLDQLFDVADAGEVMPPKSTWFEPKLREGVVARRLR